MALLKGFWKMLASPIRYNRKTIEVYLHDYVKSFTEKGWKHVTKEIL